MFLSREIDKKNCVDSDTLIYLDFFRIEVEENPQCSTILRIHCLQKQDLDQMMAFQSSTKNIR